MRAEGRVSTLVLFFENGFINKLCRFNSKHLNSNLKYFFPFYHDKGGAF